MPPPATDLKVLGVRVDVVRPEEAIARISGWIDHRIPGNYVTLTNVHMVVEARQNERFRQVMREAALCLPDGMPLVWIARAHGLSSERISGPDFMMDFFAKTSHKKYRHYLFGGSPGVADELRELLAQRFPGSQIVGTMSPPFRALSAEEDEEIVREINAANPDVVWVALGCPKQEAWMHAHRHRLSAPVMLGVGQAFNVHTGHLPRAPRWMCESGLEWLFRLSVEPRRLWRRYLFTNTVFLGSLFAEAVGLKRFE